MKNSRENCYQNFYVVTHSDWMEIYPVDRGCFLTGIMLLNGPVSQKARKLSRPGGKF